MSERIFCLCERINVKIKKNLPIIFDMNLDLSIGGIHLEAIGRIAGQVAPSMNPSSTLKATIHPNPAAAAPGVRSVRTLANSVQ